MISGIILIFAVPMVIAALLISPTAFHDLTHGLRSRPPDRGMADLSDRVRFPDSGGYPISGSHPIVAGRHGDGRRCV